MVDNKHVAKIVPTSMHALYHNMYFSIYSFIIKVFIFGGCFLKCVCVCVMLTYFNQQQSFSFFSARVYIICLV